MPPTVLWVLDELSYRRVHHTAVGLPGGGAASKTKSKLVISEGLQGQVLLSACLMSFEQLLEAKDKVDVMRSYVQSSHGLVGMTSNCGRVYAVRRHSFANSTIQPSSDW